LSLNRSLVEDLFKKIIGPFAAVPFADLMVEPDNSEDRVNLIAETFNKFPILIPPFNILIKGLNPDAAEAVLEEKIRFYATKHTRNWLIVNLMNQVLNIKELKLDEATGRLPGKPHELIKFAIEARNAFGEESRYKDQAFQVGLMFDFLFYLQRTTFVDLGQSKFDEPIAQAFKRATDAGKLILKISRHKPKLTLERYALLTPFMRELSQVALYLLKPNEAPEFYKSLEKIKHTETVRLSMEMQKFGVHTGIISAYLAQSMPAFGQLGEAMSIWGFPYLSWLHSHREAHDLSAMGLLGVSIAERLKGADFPGDGKVGITIPELVHLDVELNAEVKSEIKI
jgi:hypothetical protein